MNETSVQLMPPKTDDPDIKYDITVKKRKEPVGTQNHSQKGQWNKAQSINQKRSITALMKKLRITTNGAICIHKQKRNMTDAIVLGMIFLIVTKQPGT